MTKLPRITRKIFSLTQNHGSHREVPQGLGEVSGNIQQNTASSPILTSVFAFTCFWFRFLRSCLKKGPMATRFLVIPSLIPSSFLPSLWTNGTTEPLVKGMIQDHFFFCCFLKDFIHLLERESERERERAQAGKDNREKL